MKRIIYFLKYHNLIPIILGLVLLATAGAFANEGVRNAVIGEKIEVSEGIDNSQLLAIDLDNFDFVLKINQVSEDEENYFIDCTYQTLAIKDNAWQPVIKEQKMTVLKKVLANRDLGLYIQEELSELALHELNYLKEVQATEKEKGVQKLVASIDYTGLIGLVLDVKNKILPGYQPVITEEICDGIDNNRDGLIDEGFGQVCCGKGACSVCLPSCLNGVLQTCNPGIATEEICDGIDNNCNGQTDEIALCQPAEEIPAEPELPFCLPTTEICDGIDNDCDGMIDEGGVCQVSQPPAEQPPAGEPPVEPEPPACQPSEEICDGLDNDCDGEIDENVDCGKTSCDATLNLVGECQNSCNGMTGCGTCTPTCTCAEGFSNCDNDLTNGCETASSTCPTVSQPID